MSTLERMGLLLQKPHVLHKSKDIGCDVILSCACSQRYKWLAVIVCWLSLQEMLDDLKPQ